MMIHVRVQLMGSWEDDHMTTLKNGEKVKVVALQCSFKNLFEICSEVLWLWRYEVKDFLERPIFFCFLYFSL